jgi:hypothetical protein
MRFGLEVSPPVPWYAVLGAWAQNWLWYPLFGLATTFTVLLYPSGLPSRRWRPVLATAIVSIAAIVAMGALAPTLQVGDTGPTVDNPLSFGWLPSFADGEGSPLFVAATLVGLLGCSLAAVVSAVIRYRRAAGVERLQLRWFAFAVVTVVVAEVVSNLPLPAAPVLPNVVADAALCLVPISCGVAILRYRLYDIDRVISRTTSYALVTGLLLACYAVVVTLVPRLLPVSSSFAVAAATLAAAAAARPLLRRVRVAVDRRFNRARVDAERTVQAFGTRLRDEVDPGQVVRELVGATHATMQPATVGVWLRATP